MLFVMGKYGARQDPELGGIGTKLSPTEDFSEAIDLTVKKTIGPWLSEL